MNKKKIIEYLEKDFITLANLEGSLHYAIKQHNNKQQQMKILHAAFKRTCDIMLKRRKCISKQLKTPLKLIGDPKERELSQILQNSLKKLKKHNSPKTNSSNKG